MDCLNAEMKHSRRTNLAYPVLCTFFFTSNIGQENDMLKVHFLNIQKIGLVFNFWRVVYKKCSIGTEKDKIKK